MNGARNIRNFRLRHLHGRLGDIAVELTRVQFTQLYAPHAWEPPINVYRYDGCIKICVDLAGVERETIDLRVEPGRLVLRGRRAMPQPRICENQSEEKCVQILTMEIDHGPFAREVLLPADVEINAVSAQQENGLLWISLPLQSHA